MKSIICLTFVLLAAPSAPKAQLSAEAAAALDTVESPALSRGLRARAEVHAAVERFSARLGLTDTPMTPRLLAQNTPRREPKAR